MSLVRMLIATKGVFVRQEISLDHCNKRCPCMPSDFIRFGVNSLV